MTIIEAIKEAMKLNGGPMTIREAHDAIVSAGLYRFNAEKPVQIVASQIRRHCKDLDFPSASDTKHFEIIDADKYYFLAAPIYQKRNQTQGVSKGRSKSLLRDVHSTHDQYEKEFRHLLLAQLKKLAPDTFEHFSKKLLEAYGFVDVQVTRYTKDGGIDGFGKLKVGFAHMKVGFQCKRYGLTNVGRPEIDQFRGAVQGKCEQGIFFTTSTFARGAEDDCFRPGAVPVILIDGKSIVDLMIQKKFGVTVESLPVYSYALDLVLSDEVTNSLEG